MSYGLLSVWTGKRTSSDAIWSLLANGWRVISRPRVSQSGTKVCWSQLAASSSTRDYVYFSPKPEPNKWTTSLTYVSVMPFGEIVCGSPGSGKSTYCFGKYQLFTALNRPVSVVNLDPANDALPYPCAIDISSLITLEDVMDKHGLGPNGGLLYCMEYLEVNFDWLEGRLKELGDDAYVLFDLPGQVELSTNHESIKRIVERLTKNGFRVCLYTLSQF